MTNSLDGFLHNNLGILFGLLEYARVSKEMLFLAILFYSFHIVTLY